MGIRIPGSGSAPLFWGMTRIALQMLFGARGRYGALIFGLAFAVLLSTQQVAILLGVLDRSTGLLQTIGVADVWVVSRDAISSEYLREMHSRQLARVRSVRGVRWAEPLILVSTMGELPDGSYSKMVVVGFSRSSKVGRPPDVLSGDLADLELPDTAFMEISARRHLPDMKIGGNVHFQGRRARIVGICRARGNLEGMPIFYMSLENVREFFPLAENRLSAILVKLALGAKPAAVCHAIDVLPDVEAFPADDLRWKSMRFVLLKTAIGLNFAITATLGFAVGLVLATVALYQFTSENLPYYALLKAVGAHRTTLIRLVLTQALTAGLIGYGIGIGLAGLITLPGLEAGSSLACRFPWPLLICGMLPMLLCVSAGSAINLRRVLRVDPVILFQ